ncbi:hypothetical protein [Streptomyces sp. TS71-3]|uniref:hypothetical protein n=1 Tax=Streptomyces sp. TS71-3 TaxID=2733862 RepID=UPI001B22ED61|nr:hypothetical protein [Streptomyces sp. TS71-3]GHJ39711.1 hypothetical protein Sm713_53200 [Streptomyces sp. TS71-3]
MVAPALSRHRPQGCTNLRRYVPDRPVPTAHSELPLAKDCKDSDALHHHRLFQSDVR